jgi:hypothetical protein
LRFYVSTVEIAEQVRLKFPKVFNFDQTRNAHHSSMSHHRQARQAPVAERPVALPPETVERVMPSPNPPTPSLVALLASRTHTCPQCGLPSRWMRTVRTLTAGNVMKAIVTHKCDGRSKPK